MLTGGDWGESRRAWAAEMVGLGLTKEEAEAEAARKSSGRGCGSNGRASGSTPFSTCRTRPARPTCSRSRTHPDVDWESEDAPELPEPPEEAVAQAIYAEVMAALNEDRWPRHLHFRDV